MDTGGWAHGEVRAGPRLAFSARRKNGVLGDHGAYGGYEHRGLGQMNGFIFVNPHAPKGALDVCKKIMIKYRCPIPT